MSDPIVFVATLPDIQSAITLSGQGTGARIKLDIPPQDVPKIVELQMRGSGKPLRVTVEIIAPGIADDPPMAGGAKSLYGDLS